MGQFTEQLKQFARKHGDNFGVRTDADALVFARQVEHVYSETYDIEYPELKMANGDVVDFDTSVPDGAQTFTYYTYGSTGIAAILNSYSKQSVPRVGRTAKKSSGNVRFMGNQYAFNIEDLAAAQMTGEPLDSALSDAAKVGHFQLWNTIGWFGDATHGLFGFLNHPNITQTLAPFKSGGSVDADRLWSAKTFAEILADVTTLINTPRTLSNGVENVTHVIFPDSVWTALSGRAVDPGNGSNLNIAEWIKLNFPNVTFSTAFELQAGNHDGTEFGSYNVAVAYAKNKRKVSFVMPRLFTQMPPQWDGFEMATMCHSKTGGIKMPYPLSVHVMRGI